MARHGAARRSAVRRGAAQRGVAQCGAARRRAERCRCADEEWGIEDRRSSPTAHDARRAEVKCTGDARKQPRRRP